MRLDHLMSTRALRKLAVSAMAMALLLSSAVAAQAADPNLGGEVLTGTVGGSYSSFCGGEYPTDSFEMQYSTGGSATGPFIGTYFEQSTPYVPGEGLIVVRNGVVMSFEAEFIITAGDTTITGTKSLISGTGSCTTPNRPMITVLTSYTASITTPDGSYTDSGISTVHVSLETGRPFLETYSSSVASGPATITLSPPDAVNQVGTSHTVTATVRDAFGSPVAGATVRFSVSGSSSASGSCTTDSAGQCSFTYTGPLLPGADVITAYADSNGNGNFDAGEPMAEATKAWTIPASTPGQTTGGGQTLNNTATDKIAFGYNAQSTNNGLKGTCEVVDPSPATNVKIKCLDVTALVTSGTHATFFGNATVNGTATTYRIDVDDLGEPGSADTFRVVINSGYSAGGTLTNGNIQIHN